MTHQQGQRRRLTWGHAHPLSVLPTAEFHGSAPTMPAKTMNLGIWPPRRWIRRPGWIRGPRTPRLLPRRSPCCRRSWAAAPGGWALSSRAQFRSHSRGRARPGHRSPAAPHRGAPLPAPVATSEVCQLARSHSGQWRRRSAGDACAHDGRAGSDGVGPRRRIEEV